MKFLRYVLLLAMAISLWAAPQASTAKQAAKSGQKAATSKAESKAPAAKQLDINTASEADLKQLPGIGDAFAAKIVQNRPYRSKNQLVQKKVIPQATYDKIKDMIVARQAGTK